MISQHLDINNDKSKNVYFIELFLKSPVFQLIKRDVETVYKEIGDKVVKSLHCIVTEKTSREKDYNSPERTGSVERFQRVSFKLRRYIYSNFYYIPVHATEYGH